MRKVPLKNYIILSIIFIITIGLLFYFINIYNLKKEYLNSTNVRLAFLKEINESDLDNYISENSEFILYISNSESEEYKSLENKLKKYRKEEYMRNVIYLNSKDLSSDFINKLDNYSDNKISSIPNIIVFDENRIIKTDYFNSDTSVEYIISIFSEYYD